MHCRHKTIELDYRLLGRLPWLSKRQHVTLAYTEWGDPYAQEAVFCVHGLTQNGRSFDALARKLSAKYRVICVDMPGRGRSANLDDPMHYTYEHYLAMCLRMLRLLEVKKTHWVGTSMGGILGIVASAYRRRFIQSLVVNDVGPYIAKEGIARIIDYVKSFNTPFASRVEAEEWVKKTYAPFGLTREEDWQRLMEYNVVERRDGSVVMACDPNIIAPLLHADGTPKPIEDVDLWPVWHRIKCPILILRGENSDILPRSIALLMRESRPTCQFIEYKGVGHAPALVDDGQTADVMMFLRSAAEQVDNKRNFWRTRNPIKAKRRS